jgi:hypothetical protein
MGAIKAYKYLPASQFYDCKFEPQSKHAKHMYCNGKQASRFCFALEKWTFETDLKPNGETVIDRRTSPNFDPL